MAGRAPALTQVPGDRLQAARILAVILKWAQVRGRLKRSLNYYPGEPGHCYRASLGYLFFLRGSNPNHRRLLITIHRTVANSLQLHVLWHCRGLGIRGIRIVSELVLCR